MNNIENIAYKKLLLLRQIWLVGAILSIVIGIISTITIAINIPALLDSIKNNPNAFLLDSINDIESLKIDKNTFATIVIIVGLIVVGISLGVLFLYLFFFKNLLQFKRWAKIVIGILEGVNIVNVTNIPQIMSFQKTFFPLFILLSVSLAITLIVSIIVIKFLFFDSDVNQVFKSKNNIISE